MKSRPCKQCGGASHTTFQCVLNPRPAMKRQRAIRRIGPVTAKWLRTRMAWFHANPPDRNGLYTCYICGDRILPRDTTLDHIESRSRHPELRFEFDNLAPCCWRCNQDKGSLSLDEYRSRRNG